MNTAYTAPDHNLTDTYTDARDAYDLDLELDRAAAWNEMLSDDGDISEVLELLTEYPEDVLPLLLAFKKSEPLEESAHRLAVRLDLLTESVIEEGL